jgi:ATP-dependent Clp protease ATP-binding subunit ClpA
VFEGGAQVRRIVALAREEASRFGHRYLGPEHLPLGMLREGASEAARLLEAHGVGLAAARGQLLALAELGVVPTARPSDRALLGTLGVDLEEIRRTTEQTFGATASSCCSAPMRFGGRRHRGQPVRARR